MRKSICAATLTVGLLVFTGCVGAQSDIAEEEQVQGALAIVELPNARLIFVRDDHSVLVIEDTTSQRGPLDQLMADQPLTVLEIFKAVAPDREVPPEIRLAHPAQARSFGRSDPEAVLEVTFDPGPAQPAQPGSLSLLVVENTAWCTDWVFPPPSQSYHLVGSATASYDSTPVGESGFDFGPAFGFAATFPVTLGICNRGPGSVETRYRYDMTGDTASWLSSPWLSLGAHIRRRYFPVQHNNGNTLTKYAIAWRGPGGGGLNATGVLAVAEVVPTIR